MTHHDIAKQIDEAGESIVLIYAFNSTGKTRLSVAFKVATKGAEGAHSGVYYNAFSEDIFVWDNGDENEDGEIILNVRQSSLSAFHSLLTEDKVLRFRKT